MKTADVILFLLIAVGVSISALSLVYVAAHSTPAETAAVYDQP